jgi:membrane-associated phospholipid phosphatase
MNPEKQYVKFFFAFLIVQCAVILIVALVVPRSGTVILINGIHTPFLDSFFRIVTNLGNALIFVPLLIWTLFVEFRYSLMVLIAASIHAILVSLFKEFLFPDIMRPIVVIDNSLLHFVEDVAVHSNSTFPSGHTATIVTAVLLTSFFLKRKDLTIMLFSLGLIVGLSRVYLLQHFFQDVAGGVVVGAFSSTFSILILSFNKNIPWMGNKIQLQPRVNSGTKSVAQ